jgi:hypothetical protein
MPLADRAMALLKPPEMVAVMLDVPLAPCGTMIEVGLDVSVKLAPVPDETVSETDVVSVIPPPVPVTVIE